jgi:YegS/Rv2252/BmrU family lipid kinase
VLIGYVQTVDTAPTAAAGSAAAPGARTADRGRPPTERVGVVAHQRKTLGGGLAELRRRLAAEGVADPIWYEVRKSRKAGKAARQAVGDGARLLYVWGGDGTVQRCVDALAGSDVAISILPAGTANQLATSLGIPTDLAEAVRIGCSGERRRLDLGKVNGEHFAVMAGVGFDAEMISDADRGAKKRLGRLAYVAAALRHTSGTSTQVRISVDGADWFSGEASCVLLGNIGTISGGIRAFDDARPDDGWLDVGVTTATGRLQWSRVLARMASGRSDRSPLIRITRARKIRIRLADPQRYELDGGARSSATRLKARVVPGGITVCVPPDPRPAG